MCPLSVVTTSMSPVTTLTAHLLCGHNKHTLQQSDRGTHILRCFRMPLVLQQSLWTSQTLHYSTVLFLSTPHNITTYKQTISTYLGTKDQRHNQVIHCDSRVLQTESDKHSLNTVTSLSIVHILSMYSCRALCSLLNERLNSFNAGKLQPLPTHSTFPNLILKPPAPQTNMTLFTLAWQN